MAFFLRIKVYGFFYEVNLVSAFDKCFDIFEAVKKPTSLQAKVATVNDHQKYNALSFSAGVDKESKITLK